MRWYTVVVDCLGIAAQAEWWQETLSWHKVYEAEDEVVIVPAHATEELTRSTPWEQSVPDSSSCQCQMRRDPKHRPTIGP
jgi:hypothetical protein